MDAGKLDRRVQFQRSTLTDDGFAGVEVWSNYGTPVWASYTPVSDTEKFRSDQVAANLTARFIVRYSSFTASTTPRDRIIYGGETFDIFGVKEIGRREGYEITAGARVDD